MRTFDYIETAKKITDDETIRLLNEIYELKGKQDYLISKNPMAIEGYKTIAKIQNIISVERIFHNTSHLQKSYYEWALGQKGTLLYGNIKHFIDVENQIMLDQSKAFSIEEIIGIANLFHHSLFNKASSPYRKNNYEMGLAYIDEYSSNKDVKISYQPIKSSEVENYLNEIIKNFNDAINETNISPLVLMFIFCLDFIKICPFEHKSEFVVSLIILNLLITNGFSSFKYFSFLRTIDENKAEFLISLDKSFEKWDVGENDYSYIVKFMLRMILTSYKNFDQQILPLNASKLSKSDKVKHTILTYGTAITKAEISIVCPDISFSTIENVLADLCNNGIIWKQDDGRAASYVLNE